MNDAISEAFPSVNDVSALRVSSVSKSHRGVPALGSVDLVVEPGEIVGLLGPNGAGKTTLISIVAGLRLADEGEVSVFGVDVRRRPEAARAVLGLAPQEIGIYPSVTVRDNMTLFGKLAGLRGHSLAARVGEVAGAMGLSGLLARPARSLSGGEKRRLHLALALLHRPLLLLLDEPTSALDVDARLALLDLVRGLAREGAAVCYSTNHPEEVEALSGSVAILDLGRMIARGSLADLVERHGRPVVDVKFDGSVPEALAAKPGVEVRGPVARLPVERAESAVEEARALLGPTVGRVRKIEVVPPSLESVFLSLTGRRYDPGGASGSEGSVVVRV